MNIIRRPFRYNYSGVVMWIIGINILVMLAEQVFGSFWIELLFSMIPGLVVTRYWLWTFATYMFLHDGFGHIFFNMFALFVFGTPVERQMGSREFLFYYLISGILAGVFSFVVYCLTGAYNVSLLGASGAVFAVQLAYAVYYPRSLVFLMGILPLRAPVMVLGFTALELFSIITRRGGNVAHITHLAGFGIGWLYLLVRLGINPIRAWRR
ncbi:MAG: rhomboid family intramembrane serine protease [Treponema sp.]|jgi:membrane associated rhomboid family serine protease|nr:rhomboid family intramembrane serine protease [Treponema sp.]